MFKCQLNGKTKPGTLLKASPFNYVRTTAYSPSRLIHALLKAQRHDFYKEDSGLIHPFPFRIPPHCCSGHFSQADLDTKPLEIMRHRE